MNIDDKISDALHDYCIAWRDRASAVQDRVEAELRAAITLHVAEAVARETERCADAAREWEDNYVIEDSAPRHVDDAIRATTPAPAPATASQ